MSSYTLYTTCWKYQEWQALLFCALVVIFWILIYSIGIDRGRKMQSADEALLRDIEKLSPEQRRMVQLHQRGCKAGEIAKIMGLEYEYVIERLGNTQADLLIKHHKNIYDSRPRYFFWPSYIYSYAKGWGYLLRVRYWDAKIWIKSLPQRVKELFN